MRPERATSKYPFLDVYVRFMSFKPVHSIFSSHPYGPHLNPQQTLAFTSIILIAFREEIVRVLSSNTVDDMEQNVEKIHNWILSCTQDL